MQKCSGKGYIYRLYIYIGFSLHIFISFIYTFFGDKYALPVKRRAFYVGFRNKQCGKIFWYKKDN